jgi:hypothetical protein
MPRRSAVTFIVPVAVPAGAEDDDTTIVAANLARQTTSRLLPKTCLLLRALRQDDVE